MNVTEKVLAQFSPGGPTRPGEVGRPNVGLAQLPARESAGSYRAPGASPAATGGSPVPPAIFPPVSDNLVINAIREAIADAQDAHQLLHLSRSVIPQAMGITGEQRRELQTLVADKFTYLNIELSRREAAERL